MVYIFFAGGFEEIEGITPVDLLRRADIPVKTVGIGAKTVTGSHGIPFTCDIVANEMSAENISGIILPGGMPGARNLDASAYVRKMLEYAYVTEKLIAAICAAPFILGHSGILTGKKATCYPGYEDDLIGAELSGESTCCDGNIITSRGAGTAIEFSLKIIEYFKGTDCANKIKGSIQYR